MITFRLKKNCWKTVSGFRMENLSAEVNAGLSAASRLDSPQLEKLIAMTFAVITKEKGATEAALLSKFFF